MRQPIKGLCLIAVAGLSTTAQANHLIEIDLTVLNQITINATNGTSMATVSGSTTTGFYFASFYNGPGATGLNETLISGNLTTANNPSDNSPNLFRSGTTDPGLNVFSYSPNATSSFTAGQLAFTGSATFSLQADDYADMLAGNLSGDIYFPADNLPDLPTAQIVGTWIVIPTPGAASLAGIAGLAAVRRRR
ncbi:MAG: hypothetical protein RLN60_02265 [Phycisphaerales bacterium]